MNQASNRANRFPCLLHSAQRADLVGKGDSQEWLSLEDQDDTTWLLSLNPYYMESLEPYGYPKLEEGHVVMGTSVEIARSWDLEKVSCLGRSPILSRSSIGRHRRSRVSELLKSWVTPAGWRRLSQIRMSPASNDSLRGHLKWFGQHEPNMNPLRSELWDTFWVVLDHLVEGVSLTPKGDGLTRLRNNAGAGIHYRLHGLRRKGAAVMNYLNQGLFSYDWRKGPCLVTAGARGRLVDTTQDLGPEDWETCVGVGHEGCPYFGALC